MYIWGRGVHQFRKYSWKKKQFYFTAFLKHSFGFFPKLTSLNPLPLSFIHQLIQIVLLPRSKLQYRWPDSKLCRCTQKWGFNNRYSHAEGWTTPLKSQNWNGWQYFMFTLSVAHHKLMKTYVVCDNIYNSWMILKGSKMNSCTSFDLADLPWICKVRQEWPLAS